MGVDALQFVDSSGLTMLLLSLFSIFLCTPEYPWYRGVIGLALTYTWIYVTHRLSHSWPTEGPLSVVNWHWWFHHRTPKLLDRTVELAIETFNDLVLSLGVLALQYVTGVWWIPPWVVVFYSLVWTSTHIYNYSIVGSSTHRNHHEHVFKNYGPDVMDHLFGSNHEETLEDIAPISFNAILAFLVTMGLKQLFHPQAV